MVVSVIYANFAHGCSLPPRSYRRSHVRPRRRGLAGSPLRSEIGNNINIDSLK